MKLYMIRHGQSVTNRDHVWTGWMDVPLTEKGRSDAEHARALLKDVKFDKIYSSDLIRARRTAETVIGAREYETTPLIREINVGSLAGTPIKDAPEVSITNGERDYSVFGGESPADFRGRIRTFLDTVKSLDCETAAAFSHAGALRMALSLVLDTKIPNSRLLCTNCTVAIFEYTNDVWRLHSWMNL